MLITPQDQARLGGLFLHQAAVGHSTCGIMLERAALLGTDENGQRIGRFRNAWAEGEHVVTPPKFTRAEPSYTPNTDVMEWVGEASRRFRAVQCRDPLAAAVLEAYYGDRGARWAQISAEREIDNKVVAGIGPGSIAAIYRYTNAGRRLLDRLRSDLRKTQPDAHRTDDELLETLFVALSVRPSPVKSRRLEDIRSDAEVLLRQAWRTYSATAVTRRRRAIAS